MNRLSIIIVTVLVLLVVGLLGGAAFVYSGTYNIGADVHHTAPVRSMIGVLVDRSVARRAGDLVVPDLTDPQRVLVGADHYAEMCTGCHLAPGLPENEMRPGLYPKPPQLAKFRPDPREAFWIIKHGIKMSAMPAWGGTHDDATIWSMVAFLQQMPGMSPQQYLDIVAKAKAAGGDDEHAHGASHQHSHATDDAVTAEPMPGMAMPADADHPATSTSASVQH